MATAGIVGKGQTTTSNANENILNGVDLSKMDLTTIAVRVRSTSAAACIVRIPELHGETANEGAYLPAGTTEYFRVSNGGINAVYVGGDGGTATIDWYATAKTNLR